MVAIFFLSPWWSGGGCLGGRWTGDLYPGPWAGVAVCCCGHAVDTSVARGKWVFFFPVSVGGLGMEGFEKSRFSAYWRFGWTVGGRELVFVNVYLPLSLSFYNVLL